MFIFDGLERLFQLLYKGTENAFHFLLSHYFSLPESHPFQAYSAKFISPKEVLRKKHQGFCLDGKKQLDRKASFRNALIVGGTGVGKSSVVLIPSLLHMEGSFVIHDPSGELYAACAKDLKRRGYSVLVLDFSNPKTSIPYNPIRYARTTADANKLASLLIRHTLGDSKGDPFWNLQAANLLSLVIRMIRFEPEKRQHFREVRHMVQRLSVYPDRFLRKLAQLSDLSLRREFEAFLQYDDKVKAGVVATVLSSLHLFQDETINKITEGNSMRLETIRHQKTALFIQSPLADQNYYIPLTSLFFEQLFSSLMRWLPKKYEEDVFCLMDEAGVLHIPSLANVITNVRKYQVGVLLAIQDEEQLVHQYGKEQARTIVSNCFSKVFFTGQSLASAIRIEELAGSFINVDETGHVLIRPLITRDEIRTLPANRAILLAGNHHPMLMTLKPYYQNKALQKRTQ